MDQINWGIIGCGDVTEIKSGPAFQKVPHSKLTAVMRRNAAKAADYARRHGVEKWYSDAQKLIDDPDVNAIYIATPPSSHLEYAKAAISAGKPVYVEKPMAMSTAEATLMNELAIANGVKLSIAHYRRELPLFLEIEKLLAEGAIGAIRFAALKLLQAAKTDLIANSETSWRTNPDISGGGLFHDLAPHQLDLMLHWFGAVEQTNGFSLNQSKANASDDLVSGTIMFKNGVLFNGIWCFNVAPEDATDQCVIYGSEGRIQFSFFGNSLSLTNGGDSREISFDTVEHVQQPMINKVVAYFLGRGENPCPALDGVATMALMDSFTKKSK
ncbi:Gfo/Idh/MocA family protein [Niabella insulamsoli]|uniref:Gfo/Idh/MocA family protein n=1 Tax=Niabella insulamsoli TaxID=3144874 RepID=UPI0031FCC355